MIDDPKKTSSIWGVSVRAWLTVVLVSTTCCLGLCEMWVLWYCITNKITGFTMVVVPVIAASTTTLVGFYAGAQHEKLKSANS